MRGKSAFRRSDLSLLLQECGAQALPIVSLISLLVGLILAFVGAIQLKLFAAQVYVADIVAIAMVRVMGAIMATLLVPYAAVGHTGGIPDANKGTTIFSITNVSAAATIVHVTLWVARSDPGIDFDVILSGYDTWQINFRDAMLGRFDLFDTDDAAIAALAAPSYFQPFEWGPDGLDSNQPLTGWPTNDHEAQGALPLPQNRNVITSCPTAPPYGNLSGLSSQIINKFIDVLVPHNHAGCTVGTTTTLPRTDKTSWTTILGNDPIVTESTLIRNKVVFIWSEYVSHGATVNPAPVRGSCGRRSCGQRSCGRQSCPRCPFPTGHCGGSP